MLIVLISGALQALGQIVMDDEICVGTNRRYWVVGSAGSVYTWKIDGVVQTSTADFLNKTWGTTGTFTIEVQEHLDNCSGDVQTGVVKVVDFPVLDTRGPVFECESYTLPPITGTHLTSNAAYYNNDPALGGKIISGIITSSLKVWIFDETKTTPNCTDKTSFQVTINPLPNLVINQPLPECSPKTVDLTVSAVTAGSDAGLNYTYWKDFAATSALTTPSAVAISGTYYIKATNPTTGCFVIRPVNVTINPAPQLIITNPFAVCFPATVDLTVSAVTTGSDSGLDYTYWTDITATTSLLTPSAVTTDGIYYIKATNATTGCHTTKAVKVTINPLPILVITNPSAVCSPGTIDLTAPAVTTGSDIGLTYTYWKDITTTSELTTPSAVATDGTYYIKATNPITGCYTTKSVKVTIDPLPNSIVNAPLAVCYPGTVDLTALTITAGSDAGLSYSYWKDITATSELTTPSAVAISDTYYIKATNPITGCYTTKSVKVTIDPLPNLIVNAPLAVCFPATVDLTVSAVTTGSDSGLDYTYWTDITATTSLLTPSAVTTDGIYYIKATNPITGCYDTKAVKVTINPLPKLITNNPSAVCSPETIDLTAPAVTTGSDIGLTYTYWNDVAATSALATPSAVAIAGTYYIKGTNPITGCSTEIKSVNVTIIPETNPIFTQIDPLCQNSVAPVLLSNSTNGITGTWSPATINTLTAGTTTYSFTPAAGQCATPTSLDIDIIAPTLPLFTAIGPLCQGTVAPVLPATSTNGISGTWEPAVISTLAAGTITYTFTPTAGQCAISASLDIEITAPTLPLFTAIGPLCQNSTAPVLPATSTNGITGTWSPATVNTLTAGTITYTFTPTAGQCATSTSLDIEITAPTLPLFTAIGPLCQNSVAPVLPAISTNGISGTWSPTTINTLTAGTTTYMFTPTAGQCATSTSLDIEITAPTLPLFTAIGPLCQNSIAPVLPATSTDGITGTWSPATISTLTAETTTYMFTPTAGQCATSVQLDIEITAPTLPLFTAIGPLCQNSVAPFLPTTSTDGITGTWSPATISTLTAETTTYMFTPTAGQCATSASLDIEITAPTLPMFTAIGPLCQNSTAPVLPATSTNGITGTWSPAMVNTLTAGTITYTFTPTAGLCATSAPLDIEITAPTLPLFTAIGPLCQNSVAPVLPATSTNGITGTWSPAMVNTLTAGTITYTFTPTAGLCATSAPLDIEITAPTLPLFTAIGPLCQNSVAPVLPATSTNGISGTWSPATINTLTAGTTTYMFTPTVGQCATSTSLDIEITAPTLPLFTAIGPLCQNSIAPVLPATSTDGITGTWSPTTISTLTAETTTYMFTPTAGLCATKAPLDIEIMAPTLPLFTAIGPLCQNSVAPFLPTTSTDGITGTWSPATISTLTAETTTYMFTPTAGKCATSASLDIEITAPTFPLFTAIGPLCQGTVAPVLPATSTNGISGTWEPAVISTLAAGTITYTFTPTAGQCAISASLDIEITAPTLPLFTAIGPLCQNSAAPVLPATSTNGISGTWSPATISTLTVEIATYMFTPTAGQCATSAPLDIEITTPILPLFTAIGPLCQNSTAPVLPTTSTDGISGTWSPTTINTLTAGTTTYVFTPTAGQCATSTSLDIEITAPTLPLFTAIGPLCQNSVAPVLPSTSTNGITGTWSPATINTLTAGTATYTFTPTDGLCATSASLDIEITAPTLPLFTAIGPLCQNSTAPVLSATSTNGITGDWSPATINTLTAGTVTYTFTPTDGKCATSVLLDIEITAPTLPMFTAIGPLCQNSVAPVLPTTSTNGITGDWSPAIINTLTTGTATYTFTPTTGLCAVTAPLDIEITNQEIPLFTAIGSLCQGSVAPVLPSTSTNGITGTWSPETINTLTAGTATYKFTPTNGLCASSVSLNIEITTPTVPQFVQIGSLCLNTVAPPLPTTSTNSITGTWNPATISTLTAGKFDYVFTPTEGLCATQVVKPITITSPVTPTFAAIGPLCFNSPAPILPKTSTNNITGIWTPGTILTNTPGSAQYTFNPNGGQCASLKKIDVVTSSPIVLAEVIVNIDYAHPLGSINLIVSGGSGSGTYSYKWSNGQTTEDVNNLSIGTYTVEVTDKNNCKASKSFRIKSLIFDISCPQAPTNIEKLSDLPAPYKDYFEWTLYGGTSTSNGCNINLVKLVNENVNTAVCPIVVTRTYQLFDDCGNNSKCDQVIVFKDNIPPVFDVFPEPIVTQCLIPPPYTYNDILNDKIHVIDNCDLDWNSFKMIKEFIDPQSCPKVITRTYQIADMSGNVSVPKVQTITVNDTEKPDISCPPLSYYNTLAEVPAQFTNGSTEVFFSAGGTIADNCGVDQSSFKYIIGDTDPTSFPRVIKRTYEIADFCGNTNQCEQTITYGPKLAPTLICPPDLNLSCSAKIPDVYTDYNLFISDGGKATTSCSVLPGTFKLFDEKTTPGKCTYEKTIVRTYQVFDNCGDPLVGTQTINIQDTDLPTFKAPDDITIYTDAKCIYNKTVAVTGDVTNEFDNCSTGLNATFVDAAPVALTDCQGGFTIARTWSLRDECGNLAKDQVQKITVRDNLAPIISGTTLINACGTKPVPYSNFTEFTKDGGKASDNCSLSESSFKFISDTPVSATVIKRRYQISDECGNSNYFDQTININPIPSIIVKGVDPIACGAYGKLNFTFTNVPDGIYDISYNSGQLLKGVTVTNNAAVLPVLAGAYNNLKITVNGCSSPDGVSKILSDPSAPDYLVGGTPPTQCKADDGIITISNLKVSTEYSVSLDHGLTYNYLTSNPGGKIQIGQQKAGSFGIILKLLSCTGAEQPLTLSDPVSPAIVSAKPNDPVVCGGIGSIDFTFTDVPDGNYDIFYGSSKFIQVPVTDSKATFPAPVGTYNNLKLTVVSCTSPDGVDVTVNNPETPTYTVAPTNPVSCKGNDGSILISKLKINTDYLVSVDNGSKFTTMKSNSTGEIKVDLLGAGSYDVILSLAGCVGSKKTVTLTDPPLPSFGVIARQPIDCGGKGALSFSSGNVPDGLYDILYKGGQFNQVQFTNGTGMVSPQSGIYNDLKIIVNGCSSPDGYNMTLINPPAPTYTVKSTNPKGCQYNDGTITISGLTINTVFDVTTDNGANFISKASDINGEIKLDKLIAGSYDVAVRFSAGCVGIVKPVTLSDPLPPTLVMATVIQPSGCNVNGIINFSFTNVPNGKHDITYDGSQFSGVQVSNGISNEVPAMAGIYNNLKITVNGCVSPSGVDTILTEPPAPDYVVQPVHPTSCKLNDGAIIVSSLNPNRIYEVSTNSGVTFYSKASNSVGEIYIGSLVAENYGVVLSLSGCKGEEKPVTLVNIPSPEIISESHSQPTVCGGKGKINFTFNNVPDGLYTISYSSDQFDNVLVAASKAEVSALAGKYDNLKVTVNGCSSTEIVSIDLSDPFAPTVPEASVTNQPSCLLVKGTIEVTSPMGAIYEYSVDGKQYQASPVFALDPGNYTVIVKETATGCVTPAATLLTINPVPELPIAPIGSVVFQPTCDVSTGTIEVTAPLAPVYEYSVDGKPYQVSPVFAGLDPGNYTVKVKESATGCVSTAAKPLTVNKVPAPPMAPIASVTVQPSCIVTTGTIVVSAPVGAAFQYSINGKSYQVSPVFTDVDPGNYTVSVKETATNCVTQGLSPLTVNQVPLPPIAPIASVTVQPNCIVTTGTIQITNPVGAGFLYSMNGKPYQSNPKYTGLIPDNYIVKVKETATGCETSGEILIVNQVPKSPTAPVAKVIAQPDCVVPTGTIEITEPLGSNYEYSLNGVEYQANPVFAGLKPGSSYSVKVKEPATGCFTTAASVVSINDIPAGPATPVASVTVQPNCIEQTGTIKVTTPLGVGYEYSRDGLTYQSSPEFAGLTPGSYTIKVKEIATSCVSLPSAVKVVNTVPTPPAAPIASVSVQPNCDVSTGTIKVSTPLGVAYEYSLDGIKFQSSPTFAGLVSGNYTVVVKVIATKCVSSPTGVITINSAPIVPQAPVSTGNVTVCKTVPAVVLNAQNAIVAQTGINITWYNMATGGSIVTPTLSTVGNLTYYAQATNGVCISKTRTPVTLTINPLPATPKAIVSVPPTCNNLDGTVVVTSPIGAGFEYSLSNGTYQTSASFSNLKTNHYNIKVRNTMTGCVSDTVGINVPAIPPAPVIVVTASENCVCYDGKGSISFNITNAKDGIYTIKYDGGEFSNVSLVKGIAKVEASAAVYNNLNITNEATGCNSYDPLKLVNVTVTQPTQIVISETITEIDLKSGQKGAINLQVSGGTGTYSLKWSTGETTPDIKNLDEGAYTVIVTDQNGCSLSKIITIPVPNYAPVAVADNFTSSCNVIPGNLVANDSDPEGDPFFIEVVPIVNPLHGTVTINTDGTFEYVVNPRFDGTDSLRYAIYDSKHYQGDTATVYITVVLDTDHDGVADLVDADADGDGILNVSEGFPNRDTDGDGIPDYLDIDSDNDAIVDNIEAQSTPGYIQPLFKDSNGNGVDDAYDQLSGGTEIIPVDTDGDGIPDFLDPDSDDDGVPDYIEGNDMNSDGKPDRFLVGKDTDSDGLDDAYDTVVNDCNAIANMLGSNAPLQDFDGDGIKDWRDNDDDNDKILTRFEDLNGDGNFANDDLDLDGHPEYLDPDISACELFIPNAFSPNGDNIHDYFQIYCIESYPNAKMYIFDQFGNKLYEKTQYGNLNVWINPENAWWSGKPNVGSASARNEMVPPGTYYYVLDLGNGEVKKSFVFVSY
jgi:gliding motility-associated-like protein